MTQDATADDSQKAQPDSVLSLGFVRFLWWICEPGVNCFTQYIFLRTHVIYLNKSRLNVKILPTNV